MLSLFHKLFVSLVLGVFFLQASGLAEAIEEDACEEACPEEDDQGNCPPDCGACVCCGQVRTMDISVTPLLLAPVGEPLALSHRTDAPPDADPRGIDHVPRSPLA